ncbi:MAG: fimbrillin family protein [Candidatus Cryptobacteroides sp.]
MKPKTNIFDSMTKSFIYSLAILAVLISCAKTELPHFGGENDPNAVTINPSVAVLSTRSNPLGDYYAQRQFNEGDVITIKDISDGEMYTYKLTGGSWKPTDGKYLLWHDETIEIEAYYGSGGNDPDIGVLDQSDAAKIASADYMTCQGCDPFPRLADNELSFTMERRQALVTVVIDSYGNQYDPSRNLISNLKICGIIPYIRDAEGNYSDVSYDGTIGYSYSAIVPAGQNLRIYYYVEDDGPRVVTSGDYFLGAGTSYTIRVHVGKDKIELGDITVSDWTSTDWDDAEAEIYVPYDPYVTFSAESEQTFTMNFKPFSDVTAFELGDQEYFEYRVGNGEWNRFTTTVSSIPFGGSKGDLQLRGISSQGTAAIEYTQWTTISFGNDAKVSCSGDIRTLVDYKNYEKANTSNARFCRLFYSCSQLTSAPDLPATSLAESCYWSMFFKCESLTAAPALPATILAEACYNCMFQYCSALTTAPELPAETLAEACYSGMFSDCKALTTAPELPATTLADHCYSNMFQSCTSLTKTPVLPATELDDYCYFCYEQMFFGCSKLSEVWIKAKPSFTGDEGEIQAQKEDYALYHFPDWLQSVQWPRFYCTQEFYDCFKNNTSVIPYGAYCYVIEADDPYWNRFN